MRNIIIFTILLLCVCVTASADIDSYVRVGNELTLSGTSFPAKVSAHAIIKDGFEEGVVGQDLTTGSKGWGNSGNGALYNNTQAYSGTKSAYNYVETDSGGTPIGRGEFDTSYLEFTNTDTVFLTFRFRYSVPFGDGYGQQKNCRIAGPDYTTIHYSGPGTMKITEINPGLASPQKYDNNSYDAGAGDVNIGDIDGVTQNVWHKFTVYHSLSTAGVADGETSLSVLGGQSTINDGIENRLTGETFTLNSILLGLMFTNLGDSGTNPTKCEMWIDDVYCDNTRNRVVVGDASVITNCTDYVEQDSFSWTTTDIGFTLDLGAFPDDIDLWAIIMNEEDVQVGSIKIQSAPSTTGVSGVVNINGGTIQFN